MTRKRGISHAELRVRVRCGDSHSIVYTFRTNASRISIELSVTLTPYYPEGQRRHRFGERRRTNLEIIWKVTWCRLVVDTGAGTRLVAI
jgi:hypothetical protein